MSLITVKKAFGCSAVALGLALPLVGVAENSPENRDFNKRWYVGAGAGISELEPRSTTDALTITDKHGNSFHVNAGYDLSPRFSLDAYASRLGEAEVSFLDTPVGDVDYEVYGLSLISYLFNAGSPYSDSYDNDGLYQREGLSAYLRLGVGTMTNDTDEPNYDRDYTTHFASGLGLEYGWSNGFAVRAELSAYDTDARQLSLSALKRIGKTSYASTAAVAAIPTIVATTQAETNDNAQEAVKVLDQPLVLFAFDSTDVRPGYVADLQRLAKTLRDQPSVHVQIDGHSDSVGDSSYNMNLSVLRAYAVRSFLVGRGVALDRLHVKGYGELSPIADNRNAKGRARNRRVEISRLN